MKYLSFVISGVLVLFIGWAIKISLMISKENKEQKNNIIKHPQIFMYIGLAEVIFCDVLLPILCFFELDPTMLWYEALIFCFCLTIPFNILGVYLILMSAYWKVVVYDTFVEYFNLFNKKRILEFKDYQVKKHSASLRITKKIKKKDGGYKTKTFVNISLYCTNTDSLIEMYESYRKK